LTDGADRLSEAPIFIDDTPGITVLELRAKARRLKAERNLGLVVVDYLQLMQGRNSEKSAAGDFGDFPFAQGPGQGIERSGGGPLAVEPLPREPYRQASHHGRPA
jgi:hypothetical protein